MNVTSATRIIPLFNRRSLADSASQSAAQHGEKQQQTSQSEKSGSTAASQIASIDNESNGLRAFPRASLPVPAEDIRRMMDHRVSAPAANRPESITQSTLQVLAQSQRDGELEADLLATKESAQVRHKRNTATTIASAPKNISHEKLVERFDELIDEVKQNPISARHYDLGYRSTNPPAVEGYYSGMTSVDIMRLGVGNLRRRLGIGAQLKPEELGALARRREELEQRQTIDFEQKIDALRISADKARFEYGFQHIDPKTIPGYKSRMTSMEVMLLGLQAQRTPEEMGALHRRREKIDTHVALFYSQYFNEGIGKSGGTITSVPQGYYLTLVNQLSEGQCAGLSVAMSVALANGTEDQFMTNMALAMAQPDHQQSRIFIDNLTALHQMVNTQRGFRKPWNVRIDSYTRIVPQLRNASATTILTIDTQDHAMLAGVTVDASGKRAYFFYDPNFGLAKFNAASDLDNALKECFVNSPLASKYMIYGITRQGNPRLEIGVFDTNRLAAIALNSGTVRDLSSQLILPIDVPKIVDTSRVRSAESFAQPGDQSNSSARKVLQSLKNIHHRSGMDQYHSIVETRKAIKAYMLAHPHSSRNVEMKALDATLIDCINNARAPLGRRHAFERMENQRLNIVLDQLTLAPGSPSIVEVTVHGRKITFVSDVNVTKSQFWEAVDAMRGAVAKIDKAAADQGKLITGDLNVVLADPNAATKTRLYMAEQPYLVIGGDFYKTGPVSNHQAQVRGGQGDSDYRSVADRIADQLGGAEGASVISRQEGVVVNQLAHAITYALNPKAYLRASLNPASFVHPGEKVSQLATKNQLEFQAESFTTLVYEGSLAPVVNAELAALSSPLPTPWSLPPNWVPPNKNSKLLPGRQDISPSVYRQQVGTQSSLLKQLKALDDTQPKLRIGEAEISRVELYKTGATIDAKRIDAASLLRNPSSDLLAKNIRFPSSSLINFLKESGAESAERIGNFMVEATRQRPEAARPLLQIASTHSPTELASLQKLQSDLQRLSNLNKSLHDLESSKQPLPDNFWKSAPSSNVDVSTNTAGVGLLLYSSYKGILDGINALRSGDRVEAAISFAAVASEYAGIGVEVALNKASKKLIESASPSVYGFKSTSFGKAIGRIAGVAGSAITAPLDIYAAVNSFAKAANSTGKQAQDHYVAGGIAIASAATSVTLAGAFLAGASGSGPAGLAAAAVIIIGSQIYSAVRAVENIEMDVSLSADQRLRTGWNAFWGVQPDYDVMQAVVQTKGSADYIERQRAHFTSMLNGEFKNIFESVVLGGSKAEIRPVGHDIPNHPFGSGQIAVPTVVGNVDLNDRIDGRNGIRNLPDTEVINGSPGERKGILWNLGDGDDSAHGVAEKANAFVLGSGSKTIVGGNKDDVFILKNSPLRQNGKRVASLNGGAGNDTLILSEAVTATDPSRPGYIGHIVDLEKGFLKTRKSEVPADHEITSTLTLIENIDTVKGGKSIVSATDTANRITVNGVDRIYGRGGDDQIVINGGGNIHGNDGKDTYIIKRGNDAVDIHEADGEESTVMLDYAKSEIASWRIVGADLKLELRRADDKNAVPRIVTFSNFVDPATSSRLFVLPKQKLTFITSDAHLIQLNVREISPPKWRVRRVDLHSREL